MPTRIASTLGDRCCDRAIYNANPSGPQAYYRDCATHEHWKERAIAAESQLTCIHTETFEALSMEIVCLKAELEATRKTVDIYRAKAETNWKKYKDECDELMRSTGILEEECNAALVESNEAKAHLVSVTLLLRDEKARAEGMEAEIEWLRKRDEIWQIRWLRACTDVTGLRRLEKSHPLPKAALSRAKGRPPQ